MFQKVKGYKKNTKADYELHKKNVKLHYYRGSVINGHQPVCLRPWAVYKTIKTSKENKTPVHNKGLTYREG